MPAARPTAGPARGHALRWAASTIAIAATAATAAYFVGHAKRDAAPQPSPRLLQAGDIYASGHENGYRDGSEHAALVAKEAFYERGLRAGRRRGAKETRRRYAPGALGHRRIYTSGRDTGRSAAFDGFGRWQAGGLYLVTVDPRPGGEGIASRIGPIEPGKTYALCANGRDVCASPVRRGARTRAASVRPAG